MDESTNPRREGPAEANSNADVSLGVVFLAVGVTLVVTLDTPWAGLPMLGVGLFYLVKSLRDMRKEHARPTETPDA